MADGSRSFFCLPSSWAGRHISMRLRTQQPIPLIPQDPGLDNPRQMACRRASSAGPEPLSTRLQRASPGPRLQLPETSRVSPCAGGGPTAGPWGAGRRPDAGLAGHRLGGRTGAPRAARWLRPARPAGDRAAAASLARTRAALLLCFGVSLPINHRRSARPRLLSRFIFY